jgi:hypothetical protein
MAQAQRQSRHPMAQGFRGNEPQFDRSQRDQRRSEMLDESRIFQTKRDFRGRPLARVRFAAKQR